MSGRSMNPKFAFYRKCPGSCHFLLAYKLIFAFAGRRRFITRETSLDLVDNDGQGRPSESDSVGSSPRAGKKHHRHSQHGQSNQASSRSVQWLSL